MVAVDHALADGGLDEAFTRPQSRAGGGDLDEGDQNRPVPVEARPAARSRRRPPRRAARARGATRGGISRPFPAAAVNGFPFRDGPRGGFLAGAGSLVAAGAAGTAGRPAPRNRYAAAPGHGRRESRPRTHAGSGLACGRPPTTTVGTVSSPSLTARTAAAPAGSRQMSTQYSSRRCGPGGGAGAGSTGSPAASRRPAGRRPCCGVAPPARRSISGRPEASSRRRAARTPQGALRRRRGPPDAGRAAPAEPRATAYGRIQTRVMRTEPTEGPGGCWKQGRSPRGVSGAAACQAVGRACTLTA